MNVAHAVVERSEIWSAWAFDPIAVVALVGAAGLYARGVARLWRDGRRGVRRRQVVAFYAALVLTALALLSPLEALAGTLVAGHMAQHLVFLLIAPPLFVYGASGLVMTSALPTSWHRGLNRWGRGARSFVSGAAVAVILHAGTMWAWHLPGPYGAAVENEMVHALEHGAFLATALLFWAIVIQPRARRRVPYPVALLGVIVVWMLSGGLGALLSFGSRPLYPVLAHDALAWGIAPLADQQLAGVIMWVPAGFSYLIAMAILFVRWMDSMERRMQRSESRAAEVTR